MNRRILIVAILAMMGVLFALPALAAGTSMDRGSAFSEGATYAQLRSAPANLAWDGSGMIRMASGGDPENSPLYKARPPLPPRERPQAVPEPLTLVLLVIGLACIGLLLSRKALE